MGLKAKTVFREVVGHMPLWVHKAFTKAKIKQLTAHLMTKADRERCLAEPDRMDTIVAGYRQRYPQQAKRLDRDIEALFQNNPRYKDRPIAEKEQLAKDIGFCYFGYGFPVDEYAFLHLDKENRGQAQREQMVSDLERLCFRFSANDFTCALIADKARAARFFAPYYKRDLLFVQKNTDYEAFEKFASKHHSFAEKPVALSGGRGVQKVTLPNDRAAWQAYFREVQSKGGILLEELICQSGDMAQFNPDSVNTVRLITLMTRDGVVTPFACFRTGRKGAFVDNGAAGGYLRQWIHPVVLLQRRAATSLDIGTRPIPIPAR